jgi:ureidoacrylate peracid hydrolase
MHSIELFPSVVERVRARVGREHPFDKLDAKRTALVVIDMQDYFVAPDSPAAVPLAPAIVPAINRLGSALRERGGHVVWVRGTARDTARSWSVFNNDLMTADRRERRSALMDGDGFAFWHLNDVRPEDVQVVKNRFSAFIEGSSDIVQHLAAREVNSLLIAGTVTGVCCESSARDAMMLNYKVIMVADALAAHSDQEHNASLSAFYATFGDVQTVEECIASLDRGSDRRIPTATAVGDQR